MEPQPGIETGSAAYEAAASPQCFRGKNLKRKRDAMRREKIDKRTALPLSIPKNGRRLHEAPSNSGRSRCQTAKVSVFRPCARARAARLHGSSARSMRAQPRMRARAIDLSRVCGFWSLYGPIGPLLPVGGG